MRKPARGVVGVGVVVALASVHARVRPVHAQPTRAQPNQAQLTHARSIQAALSRALRETQATAVVLDVRTGAVLASEGRARRGSPGSAIKPLLLAYALGHGIVRPETEVYCRRDLHVGPHSLPCTHPADHPVFRAQSALAESCNTWFAEMARHFDDLALESALQGTHLPHASVLAAGVEQRELVVLGLRGVTASPPELARAYREMLEQMPPNGPVARGLEESVEFGMAHPAQVPGVQILGKTGTATNPGEAWTHGWFAGALPGRLIIVVYVPRGDGGTAAGLARMFFASVVSQDKAQ